jgi:GNAT superfamily N-acetyltransferase
MLDLTFTLYTLKDNQAALDLEERCIQGKSLSLKFRRPSFHARSEVYDFYKIYCAKERGRLIGIIAGALKKVSLHGEIIRAAYIYDLRVHPEYRSQGVGKKLTSFLLDNIGPKADCIYTLINGQNDRALGLACRNFSPKIIVPLVYIVMPVYKKLKEERPRESLGAREVHEMFLRQNIGLEFVPAFEEMKLIGHKGSLTLRAPSFAGCSVWTNENILAEQVVRIPFHFQIGRLLARPLSPFLNLPSIPKPGEVIRSWFLFDLFVQDNQSLQGLLAAANNFALDRGRTFLYILLQNDDPLLEWIRETGYKIYTFPYYFLAKGKKIPSPRDRLYIDVRDL